MLTRVTATSHSEEGFSLVELLVVIVLLGIVGVFTLTSLVRGFEVSNEADNRVQAMTELQQGGQRLARELRVACSVETALPDQAVIDLLRDGTHYRYTIDTDADGTVTMDVDIVAADGTTSDDRILTAAEGIINGGSLFEYFDANGDPTTVVTQVRDIALTLQRSATGDTLTWSTHLHLRNGGLSCGF